MAETKVIRSQERVVSQKQKFVACPQALKNVLLLDENWWSPSSYRENRACNLHNVVRSLTMA